MELTFEEMLLAAIVKRAIRDATRDRSEKVRYEAAAWLWDVAPLVARRANVPSVTPPPETARLWAN